jgi:hypothetical protein
MAPKHKQLDLAFFTPITKEERDKDVEMEFACLNKRLDKEHAMANEKAVPKRLVGRPKKEKVAELLRPTAAPMKPSSKKTKRLEVTTTIGSLLPYGHLFLKLSNNIEIFKKHWIS